MKLSKIMLAVATLGAAGSVFAAAPAANEIAYTAGASAIQTNLRDSLAGICAANSTTSPAVTYVLSTLRQSTATNDNFASYVCAVGPVTLGTYASATYIPFSADIPYKEIRINVDQGSFSAVQQFNSISLAYFNPATNANFTPVPADIVRLGGALDVQPEAFPASTIGSLSIPATTALGVAQAFGVAASNKLYEAMYAFQRNPVAGGSATVDKPIPNSCPAVPDVASYAKLECIPTISRGQMATIMADNDANGAYSKGVGFLAGAALNGTELGYARRVSTSGTQAAAQNYFLGNVCSGNPLSVVPQGNGTTGTVIGKVRVYGAGSTGNVRTLLNDSAKYTIGVVSGENDQTGQTWKWLRVQGAPLGENAAPGTAGITNRIPVQNGSYDFYYEAVYASGGTEGDAFWGAITTAINSLTPPLGKGLIEKAVLDAGYNKGGNTCQFNSSN